MPRKVFGNLEEFKRWIEEVATPERFVFCITEEGEIIAEPTKSTRPLTYAYIRITDAKKVEEMEKMLKEKLSKSLKNGLKKIQKRAKKKKIAPMTGFCKLISRSSKEERFPTFLWVRFTALWPRDGR